MNAFKNSYHFLGFKIVVAIALTMVAALSLGVFEFLFATFLDQFMRTLGVLAADEEAFNIFGLEIDVQDPKTTFYILLLILTARGTLQLASSYGSEYTRAHFVLRLREKLFKNIIWERIERRTRLDEMGNLLGEIFPKAGEAVITLSKTAVAAAQCIVLILGMLYKAYWLTLVVISGTLLVGVVARWSNKKILNLSRKVPALNQKVVDSANQNAQNKIFIRINGMQKSMESHSVGLAAAYCRFMLRSQLYRHGLVALLPVVGLSILFSAIVFLPPSMQQSGGIFAFIILFVRFTQNLGNTANFFGAFTSFRPQLRLAYDFYQSDRPHQSSLDTPVNQDHRSDRLPEITVKDLHHSWSNESLLENVNFAVEPGSIFGFVGKSGSGKSTLMQILLGVISPKQGYVEIDGLSPDVWLHSNADRVGYVGVHPFLINGSIRENIVYGVNDPVSDEAVWQVLREVGLYDQVESWEMGLETPLNEYGDGLSSGQKQRLSLARTLLKKPLLLVLDEPTANLDETAEREIFKMIENFRKKMTIIMVCHKTSYSHLYDLYLDLESSEVLSPKPN